MFRFEYGSLVLNLMFSIVCFSFNVNDDGNTLSESFIGRENLTYETREFSSRHKVNISSNPWMAAVIVSDRHANGYQTKHCTGVLFRLNTYVMTAAHCLVYRKGAKQYLVDTSSVEVRYGSKYLHTGGINTEAEWFKIHPLYFKNGLGISTFYDIAMVKIKFISEINTPSIKFNIMPIGLRYNPTDSLHSDGVDRYPCYTVGYGITPVSIIDYSLVKVSVNLITHQECQEWLKPLNLKIGDGEICVFKSGADPCHNDGGGVLFCTPKYGLVGIFGFGVNCGMPKRPAVFSWVDFQYVQDMAAENLLYRNISADPRFADWKENLGEGFEIDSSGKPIKPKKPKKPGDSSDSPVEVSEMDESRATSFGLKLYLFLLIMPVTSCGI